MNHCDFGPSKCGGSDVDTSREMDFAEESGEGETDRLRTSKRFWVKRHHGEEWVVCGELDRKRHSLDVVEYDWTNPRVYIFQTHGRGGVEGSRSFHPRHHDLKQRRQRLYRSSSCI